MIVTTGELLIDFLPEGQPGRFGAEAYLPAPGGAPANVAVGAARLGVRAAFLGKVGDDPFGRGLVETLRTEGVDVSGLRVDGTARTALAFVSLRSAGEREFTFYRDRSADTLFGPEEIESRVISAGSVLHFGSVSLAAGPAREATLEAARLAREMGLLVSYDPNLRLALWPDEATAKSAILDGLERAALVKVSEEELEFLTGSRGTDAARKLMASGVKLLLVTRGARGATYLTGDAQGEVAGFAVDAVDTTGAGDAFMAAVLASLSSDPALLSDEAALRTAIGRANACAAICVTRRGAIPAMPRTQEVDAFVEASAP